MNRYVFGATCKTRERRSPRGASLASRFTFSASPLWPISELEFRSMEPPCSLFHLKNGLKAGLPLIRPEFCKWLFIMTITLLFLLPGVSQAESAPDNYRTYCMQCHGMHANGQGINVKDMSTGPLEHSNAELMAKRSDFQLFKVIKEGGLSINRSTLMPPWADTFTDDEINDLVKYLRKLCKCKWAGY